MLALRAMLPVTRFGPVPLASEVDGGVALRVLNCYGCEHQYSSSVEHWLYFAWVVP